MIKFGRAIPIIIHPIFWLTAAIIGWMNSWSLLGTVLWMGIILVSLLVHEFGHALSAKAFGQTAHIELVALGGFTYHDGKKLKRWQDFIVVLMGPLASILLAVGAFFLRSILGPVAPLITYTLTIFVFINIFWTVVNLLPIMPLDGGQLLRIVMEGLFGHKGLKFSLILGIVLSLGVGIASFIFGYFLIGAIMLLLAFESFATWNQVKGMTYQDRDEGVQKLLEEAQEALRLGQFDHAKEKLEMLRDKSKEGLIYDAASEQLAFIHEKEGHLDKSYELLKPILKHLSISGQCLLQRAAYHNKDYQLALNIGSKCFQQVQSHDVAFLNALASAHLKEIRPCIGWLECAAKHGLPNLKEVLTKNEFDSIRDDHDFKKFIEANS